MATPLDLGALAAFDRIFTFILVGVLVYAFLSKVDYFSGNRKVFAGIIAITISLITMSSNIVIKSVNLMAPWFVLLIIFAMFMMLAFMMFGYSLDNVKDFITKGEFGAGVWVMWLVIVIGIGSVVAVWQEEAGFEKLTQEGNVTQELKSSSQEYGFWQTLFHPKILGMALVMLVAFFTIKFMTEIKS